MASGRIGLYLAGSVMAATFTYQYGPSIKAAIHNKVMYWTYTRTEESVNSKGVKTWKRIKHEGEFGMRPSAESIQRNKRSLDWDNKIKTQQDKEWKSRSVK